MRIVAFGCSNTFGTGLDDPMFEAWPSVLGQLNECEIDNQGIPGASNLEILCNILQYKFDSDDVVIVMWAGVNRDYVFGQGQIGAWQDTELVKHWVQVHDTVDLATRSWLYIQHANLYLSSKNIQCYNFAVEYGLLKSKKPLFVDTKLYNCHVDVHRFFSRASDSIHPGKKAHQRIANKIRKIISA